MNKRSWNLDYINKVSNDNNGNFICVFECTIVISLRIDNLRMLLEIGWLKKKNQNCIMSGLSQFLFLQQKM